METNKNQGPLVVVTGKKIKSVSAEIPRTEWVPTDYNAQAQAFLDKYGIKLRVTLSDSKTAPWHDESRGERHHYRVTLSRNVYAGRNSHSPKARLTFDFFGSIADAEKGAHPRAYDVLACLSGDINTPDTFAEFCGDYGYDADSIKAKRQFNRCDRFAKRLRAFFTDEEREGLAEIQ